MKKLEASLKGITATLRKKEAEQDRLLVLTREIVRGCAVAIKHVHAREKKQADAQMKGVRSMVVQARKGSGEMQYLANTAYQEFVEAELLLHVLEKKELPDYNDLQVTFEIYLLGLMDAVGELRREMLEELKRGNRKEAEYYFDRMNAIYEATLPLKFSNSLLPNFRRKQDVARGQVEQARSELLR